MRHARADYDRIQDPAGLIGEDEPVFLLRAKDVTAADTVRQWANFAEMAGASPDMVMAARAQADRMDQWRAQYGIAQVPDAPPGSLRY